MNANFIRQRLSMLIKEKNISEYQLSLDLGRSKGYIQGITSGRALPSMQEFLNICDFFNITPQEFFDQEGYSSLAIIELENKIEQLELSDIELLDEIVSRLIKKG